MVPSSVSGFHFQRTDRLGDGRGNASWQAFLTVLVHEKAYRATVHAVDLFARAHRFAQRLQQETIASQRDDHVGFRDLGLSVDAGKTLRGGLGVFRAGRDESEGVRCSFHRFRPRAVIVTGCRRVSMRLLRCKERRVCYRLTTGGTGGWNEN